MLQSQPLHHTPLQKPAIARTDNIHSCNTNFISISIEKFPIFNPDENPLISASQLTPSLPYFYGTLDLQYE
jgi:hypothetical protein